MLRPSISEVFVIFAQDVNCNKATYLLACRSRPARCCTVEVPPKNGTARPPRTQSWGPAAEPIGTL